MFATSGASEFNVNGIFNSIDELVEAIVDFWGADVRGMLPTDMIDSLDAYEVDVDACKLCDASTDEPIREASMDEIIKSFNSADGVIHAMVDGELVACVVEEW